MNFQDLLKVEDYKFYLDLAFRRARERLEAKKIYVRDYEKRIKEKEGKRINIIQDSLTSDLNKILKTFPSINSLPEFYLELVKASLDYYEIKAALGAMNWARQKISQLSSFYTKKINNANPKNIHSLRKQYYGRISSVLKQIKRNLEYLEYSRKIMKEFPTIKTGIKTIVIVGFPNVGKTTLLYKLTGSKPEISDYSFTTKGINVGYIKNEEKIQVLDVPGTLNRFDKMNKIEKIAYIALRHLAEVIIYVFDLTEPYSLEEQKKLLENIKNNNKNKKIIIHLSKVDILEEDRIKDFLKEYKCIINIEELKKII